MTQGRDEKGTNFGVAWLLADMTLVTAMTVIVKAQGSVYPAIQLVFIRSVIGLISVTPLAWAYRREIVGTKRPARHAFRVACNALALTCNFAALTALPLALVNAIGFMRPLIVMVFAVLMLGEIVTRIRWIGAVIGLAGVLIMVAPGEVALSIGLAAALGSVLFGSLATVQTRALKDENTTVLMVFYTVGLTLFTAIPAMMFWQPIAASDWLPLIGIGLLAQIAQFCFLRAYQSTPASILAPVGYLTIVFATIAGYVFFGEIPQWTTLVGVVVILIALQMTGMAEAAHRRKSPLPKP